MIGGGKTSVETSESLFEMLFRALNVLIAIIVLLAVPVNLHAEEVLRPKPFSEVPQGFGRATRPACSPDDQACLCVVSNLSDDPAGATPGTFRACLKRQKPTWIVFSARGPIVLSGFAHIPSNVTIDGRPLRPNDGPVTFTAAGGTLLEIADSQNVIVSDLFFGMGLTPETAQAIPERCLRPRSPAETKHCGVPIFIKGASRNIWINHNSFDRCGEKCAGAWTESAHLPPGERAAGGDLITFSFNRFANSYYAAAFGAGAALTDEQVPEHMRITLYDNVFDHIFRRSPRAASYSLVHVYNNLIENWGNDGPCDLPPNWGWAASSVGAAQLVLENNVFIARPSNSACKLAVQVGEYAPHVGVHRDMGKVRARGNLLQNGAQIVENEPESVFDPGKAADKERAYPYTLAGTEGLAKIVERQAGPRVFKEQ